MTPPFEEKQAKCFFKIGPEHSRRCRFGGRCDTAETCPMYWWIATEYPPPINHEKERRGEKPMH